MQFLERRPEGHPQLSYLPNRFVLNESEQLTLLGSGLRREQVDPAADCGHKVERLAYGRKSFATVRHLGSDALLILGDFARLLIVLAGIDSSIQTVVVQNIESPLEPV